MGWSRVEWGGVGWVDGWMVERREWVGKGRPKVVQKSSKSDPTVVQKKTEQTTQKKMKQKQNMEYANGNIRKTQVLTAACICKKCTGSNHNLCTPRLQSQTNHIL